MRSTSNVPAMLVPQWQTKIPIRFIVYFRNMPVDILWVALTAPLP